MSTRNTVIRSMHDVGLAAWFGGALMGAVGLNGAANDVDDPTDRATVASAGWARWAPVNAAAIGAHLIGGIGLILSNRQRLAVQGGARANTIVKTALTGVAIAEHRVQRMAGDAGLRRREGARRGRHHPVGPHTRGARRRDAAAADRPMGHPRGHRGVDRPRRPAGRTATTRPVVAHARQLTRPQASTPEALTARARPLSSPGGPAPECRPGRPRTRPRPA